MEKGSNSSGIMQIVWQMGEKFGKLETKMEGMNKENAELKDGMTDIMKSLEGMQLENEELKENVGKLGENSAENCCKIEEMNEELTGNGQVLRKLEKKMTQLKVQISGKNAKLDGQITGLKNEDKKLKGNLRELQEQINEVRLTNFN